jgi:LAO/AO transport system kinase
MNNKLTITQYLEGFKNKDRTILAKAITLVESENESDRVVAEELISQLLKNNNRSLKLGISGTPGVGKSSFIDVLGKLLTKKNLEIAVLAVDPTSVISGGSILGDKTRMTELSVDPKAYIRPSPSGKNLGGVAAKSREAMLLCEAFGFDVILVETVGVGQSEIAVQGMVDIFIMLLQPGAGDELQGIKRGILEVVDMVVVTKSDGLNLENAKLAAHFYTQALQILRHVSENPPKVLEISSIEKKGFDQVWDEVQNLKKQSKDNFSEKRSKQNEIWLKETIWNHIENKIKKNKSKDIFADIEQNVRVGHTSVYEAAKQIVSMLNK